MYELSIGIPCYNEERGIERAIRSCFMAFPMAEVIVSDNCSTDRTREILASLKQEFGNLVVLQQPAMIPLQENFGTVLKAMRGTYAIFLPAHHFLLPNSLTKLVDQMKNDPTLSVCFGGVVWRNLKGRFTLRMPPYAPGKICSKDFFLNALFTVPDAVATLYRLDSIQEKGFHPELERTGFWELLLRSCLAGNAWFEPEAITCWVEYKYSETKHRKAINEFAILDRVSWPYAMILGIEKPEFETQINHRNHLYDVDSAPCEKSKPRISFLIRRLLPGSVYLGWYSWKLGCSPFSMSRSVRRAKSLFALTPKKETS